MKILQLTPQFPFPEDDGGKISIANIYNTLLDLSCKVEMISISNFDIPEQELKKYRRNGVIHIIKKDTKNTTPRILKNFITNKCIYIEKHYSKDLISKIEALVDMKTIDVIHSDHSNMAKISIELSKKYNIPIGLRLHNVEYMIWKRYYEELGFFNPKKIFIGQQYRLLMKEEEQFLNQVDVAFSITAKDRERALEIAPSANVVVATAGVNLDIWNPNKTKSINKNSLIIATTFNWIHNINALRWFFENVQPSLKSKYKDLETRIIGKNPPAEFHQYKESGVNILGYVDDVKPYMNSSQIYIAPLFVGSGIRIKILEAMAMDLPVVATDISAEGIEADENDGLFRANTKEEYIKIIIYLLEDDQRRKDLGRKARKFIEENHTWEKNISIMLNHYKSFVSSKKNKA